MDLIGFTNPLSPSGRAELVEPTPHHISSDAIRVIFRAGRDRAARYLPDGLEPVEDGLGSAYVADMLKVSAHEPDQAFLNPERTQYGADVLIPGQTIMAEVLWQNGVHRIDDAPVVDAVGVTIKMAELLAGLRRSSGVSASRRGYWGASPDAELAERARRLLGPDS